MKTLLIAYSFPPFHDAQSIRWYYLANALAEQGVEMDVFTVRQPLEDKPMWRFHSNVRIIRAYPGPIEAVSLRIKNNLGVDGRGNSELRRSLKFRLMKSAYWGVRRLVGGILPGDIRTEWFPYALKTVREALGSGRYSCMITSHEPCVDSLLGLYIKRKSPSLRWIADFGDPYVAPYTPVHKLYLENRLERLIYESADTLIFTNKNVSEHLKWKYPSLKDKNIEIIEQGFSYASREEAAGMNDGNVFTLVYTGTFYKGLRDPTALIEALTMVDFPYRFLLAGKNESFVKDFRVLGERFEFLGFIDHLTSLRLQRGSDVLVHMGNTNSMQVPGKVFEYFGAMKPILSINSNPKDPTGKLVSDINRGVSCDSKPRSIKEAIDTLHVHWQEGNIRLKLTYEGLYEYSWKNKARMIYDILKRTV